VGVISTGSDGKPFNENVQTDQEPASFCLSSSEEIRCIIHEFWQKSEAAKLAVNGFHL
jgi:hypothetical protein